MSSLYVSYPESFCVIELCSLWAQLPNFLYITQFLKLNNKQHNLESNSTYKKTKIFHQIISALKNRQLGPLQAK